MDNKNVFASNLNHYMKLHKKTRKDICNDLGFSYYTVTDWVKGKKYPRMDKVELLANYFGVKKSDLIEEKEFSFAHDTEFADEFNDSFSLDRKKVWLETTKGQSLDDNEFAKLIEYLKFIVSQRGQ